MSRVYAPILRLLILTNRDCRLSGLIQTTFGANMMFWVYVLENPRGRFYVGQTENLTARVEDHNRTDCIEGHFTRKNGPWRLVWSEAHSSRSSAMQREHQIKRMKSAKWIRALLLASNPTAVNPDKSGL